MCQISESERKAKERVNQTPALDKHRDVILYDWPEEDHWDWVANAPIAEVVDWAETVEGQE